MKATDPLPLVRSAGTKRRIWFGLGLALGSVALWALWSKARPALLGGSDHSRQPFVQLASAGSADSDKLLQERAQMLDPTPLFFPTEWNFGQQPLLQNYRKQPGQSFGNFQPKQTINEQSIASYALDKPLLPEKLADVLDLGNEAPFAGLGMIDRVRPTLAIRSGHLEIQDLKSGNIVIGQSLTGLKLPRSDFAPTEFLVVIEAAGLIGEPIVTAGSGWDEVDTYFRDYLLKSYRIGLRLSPGRYRVVVGA